MTHLGENTTVNNEIIHFEEKGLPKVTVITPIKLSRDSIEKVREMALNQFYPGLELLFDFSEDCVGKKRNNLCRGATGDIIIHMDGDDIYGNDWVLKSVEHLISSEADITGLQSLFFLTPASGELHRYSYSHPRGLWVAGATMCYWRRVWEKCPFREIQSGEDNYFIWDHPGIKVAPHNNIDLFLAVTHEDNTSPRQYGTPGWERITGSGIVQEKMRLFNSNK